MDDFQEAYSLFLDKNTGPVRQRVAELHTAVIDLAARLQKGEIDPVWLPRHTFIVLSQIQGHAAALMEDLAFDDSPLDMEIGAMENSLDSMIDTFSEIKELINNAMDNFRKSNLTIIHGGKNTGQTWRMIQISITGLDVWRRAIVSHDCTMEQLHKLIQAAMDWKNTMRFRFYCESPDGLKEFLHNNIKLDDINFKGKKEIVYEYGSKWNVRIIIMSSYQPAGKDEMRFIAGDGAAPPEEIDGTRHFSRLLININTGNMTEKNSAKRELGINFTGDFNLEKINRGLRLAFSDKE